MLARIALIVTGFLTTLSASLPWLAKFAAWFKKSFVSVVTNMAANSAEAGARSVVIFLIETSVVLLWGIVLAAMATGVSGMSIKEFMTTNPFSGFPEAIMFLVAGAFPIHFAVGLITSYIAWRMTFSVVVLGVIKSIRFLYGA